MSFRIACWRTWLGWLFCVGALGHWTGLALSGAAEPQKLNLLSPVPHQVIQREGFRPADAHEHAPGGPALGFAQVSVVVEGKPLPEASLEYRIVALPGCFGTSTNWSSLDSFGAGDKLTARIKVAAGGWYRLEIRTVQDGKTTAAGAVEPFGVGELFLIAGQSYAEGTNDELLKVTEPYGRVVAYDVVKKSWAVAHDPPPNRTHGGTIWPPAGDLLVPLLRVPVGFVNVAVSATASRQWMPGEKLHQNLEEAGKAVGKFRYVLWQQGESDVIEATPREKYIERLIEIRKSLSKAWGFEPTWLLAKSTLHPTVYNKPEQEQTIRKAIGELWTLPGFEPGPDTDILGGENRGGPASRQHFSGIGQRRAGLM